MGKHGERSMTTQLKMVLPGSSEKLRISDELAKCFDSGDGGAGMTAFLVSPFGSAIWQVEVGRDGDGAFLGRRWAEFVEAHGISVGWFLVFRHVGRGVLTVKAFDRTFFIKDFGQTLTVPGLPAAQIETGHARKPQFLMPLFPHCMDKMPIPAEFLKRRYISDEELNRRKATFVNPSSDFWHIDLEKDGSNVFFAGGWSKFLKFQGIAVGQAILIRYQGNMIFTFEVFELTGCRQKLVKQGSRFQLTENSEETYSSQDTEQNKEANPSKKNAHSSKEAQSQKEAHISRRKRKRSEEKRMPRSSTNPFDKRTYCEYETGSQPWIRKKLKSSALSQPYFPGEFCKKVGFLKKCTITLKSSEKKGPWEVQGLVYETGKFKLSKGWSTFRWDSRLKEGDVCTFNVINRGLWHVDIERC
ncbi:hypothetical protein ACQ4PT_016451 [Festuca glaucescens]